MQVAMQSRVLKLLAMVNVGVDDELALDFYMAEAYGVGA